VSLMPARHLDDDSLYEAYLTSRRGVALDPRLAEHLVDCPACEGRYAELLGVMDDVVAAADADIDGLFPSERLRAQQARILSRLEHLARPARVLSFPGRPVARSFGAARPRVATRWIAAGAAAGLFIGVGLGLFLDFGASPGAGSPLVDASQVSSASTPAQPTLALEADDEEAFLTDLSLALESPRTRVLRGYDALTPHIMDIVDVR
jgi:hypothetical protein